MEQIEEDINVKNVSLDNIIKTYSLNLIYKNKEINLHIEMCDPDDIGITEIIGTAFPDDSFKNFTKYEIEEIEEWIYNNVDFWIENLE